MVAADMRAMLERSSVGALALIAVAMSLSALAHVPHAEPPVPAMTVKRPPSPPVTPEMVHALRDGARLDLNRAGSGELELLPGIGPALARRIVEDRRAHGPFGRVEALLRVRGIGPRTLARLQALVVVAAPQQSRAAAPNTARPIRSLSSGYPL
jgi:competence protein ComEA